MGTGSFCSLGPLQAYPEMRIWVSSHCRGQLGLRSEGDLVRGCVQHTPDCPVESEGAGVFIHQHLSHLSVEDNSWGIDSLLLLTCSEPGRAHSWDKRVAHKGTVCRCPQGGLGGFKWDLTLSAMGASRRNRAGNNAPCLRAVGHEMLYPLGLIIYCF